MATWERLTAMLSSILQSGPENVRSRGPKSLESPGLRRKISHFSKGKKSKNSLKTNERSLNVYENKGSDFCGSCQSWNLIENAGSYASETGISLKRNQLSYDSRAVVWPSGGG